MFIRCLKYTAPAKPQLRDLFRMALCTLLRFRIHKAKLGVFVQLAPWIQIMILVGAHFL